MNQNEFYKHQAKTLGEFFKHYGYEHITPVPSKVNYGLAIKIMQREGGKNAKHLSK